MASPNPIATDSANPNNVFDAVWNALMAYMYGLSISARPIEIGSGRMNGDGSNNQAASCHSTSKAVSTSQAGGSRSQSVRLSFLMLEHSLAFEDLPDTARGGGDLRAFGH